MSANGRRHKEEVIYVLTHTPMEYYAAMRKNPAICNFMGGLIRYYAIQILYDLTYLWNLKKPNWYKQRVEWQFPGAYGWGKLGNVG